ncbi:MAG: hypothetical protein JW852_01940 [Spirochaetales bacterium]|nr:hypothetical protein [Spirochaetales bacterium]
MPDAPLENALKESRYSTDERNDIERVFEEASRSGIGGGLLLPRVQEAKAKRVPAERLITALQQEIDRLENARDMLLDSGNAEALVLDDAGWQRTANLIAWGASKEEILTLAGACSTDVGKYLEASYLFTSLVEWGLEREVSVALVSAVAGSRLETDEYRGVFEVLINGRRLKMQPREIAERMIMALDEVETARQLQRKVLNVR